MCCACYIHCSCCMHACTSNGRQCRPLGLLGQTVQAVGPAQQYHQAPAMLQRALTTGAGATLFWWGAIYGGCCAATGAGRCCAAATGCCSALSEQMQATMLAPAIGGQMNQSIIWQGKHLLTSKIPCSIAGQLPATKMPGLQGARRSLLRCLACLCCPGSWQHLHTLRTRGPMQPSA